MAKGHNFPLLTLVGVIDADLGLSGSDLRAAERVFQLTRQVAGRAGRADKPGRALIQTSQPEHPVIRAILSGDEEAFWQAEAEARRAWACRPTGAWPGSSCRGRTGPGFRLGQRAGTGRRALARINAQVFGPAPAPIARIRGQHRVRLLVKATKGAPLQAALRDWTRPHKLGPNMRLVVDIDPQSFY